MKKKKNGKDNKKQKTRYFCVCKKVSFFIFVTQKKNITNDTLKYTCVP